MSGCDQLLLHGARRESIPGGSGSAPASHVPVKQYLIPTLLEHLANSNFATFILLRLIQSA